MKIHVSNSCAQLLLQAGGFELEKRGTIQVKVSCKIMLLILYFYECTTGQRSNGYMVA